MKKKISYLVAMFALVSSLTLNAFEKWECDSSLFETFWNLNTRLARAYQEGDILYIQKHLSAKHIHNNIFGSSMNRDMFLDDLKREILMFERYEVVELEVHQAGEAVVTTGKINAIAYRGDKKIEGIFRFTRVFVQEEGEWKVLLFQNTKINQPGGVAEESRD